MNLRANRLLKSIIVIITISLIGCASIPKEVVELSYTMGQDLNAVHLSYKGLIKTHFDGLRKQAEDFVENEWTPLYLKKFIEKGKLVDKAKDPDPTIVLIGVKLWAEEAISKIEQQRKKLIEPINDDESELNKSVDEVFAQLITANATITAHLNSIRKVKEVQDEALAALKLKDLRDKINNGLITASDKADEAIEKSKTIDEYISEPE
ncbi:MAG: hypothetical protein GY839_13710 [candidate division Zixibacteria bacterium]|nr:hypothetical protein [candidate division Zixibacteria bacterium]